MHRSRLRPDPRLRHLLPDLGIHAITPSLHRHVSAVYLLKTTVASPIPKYSRQRTLYSSISLLLTSLCPDKRLFLTQVCRRNVRVCPALRKQMLSKAGFDGVGPQGENGHFFRPFTQDVPNRRSEQSGESIMNRVRSPLQVIDAGMDAGALRKLGIALASGIPLKTW
ncbi:hypothetical protein F5146DRAFT_167027 [Armillaria mellea]|nr:hypothetical protein F5146DRAFT_167027 [Armillaria mellea]